MLGHFASYMLMLGHKNMQAYFSSLALILLIICTLDDSLVFLNKLFLDQLKLLSEASSCSRTVHL